MGKLAEKHAHILNRLDLSPLGPQFLSGGAHTVAVSEANTELRVLADCAARPGQTVTLVWTCWCSC